MSKHKVGDNVFGISPAEQVGQIGLDENRELHDRSPFYGPWRGAGLRVELRHIKGVTQKGLLENPYRFQVPPLDSFRIDKSVIANDYSTIQDGTYTRLNGSELDVVTFDTLVSQEPAPWVIAEGLWDPHRAAKRLSDIYDAETAFRLVAWHPGPIVELSMPVTIRSLGIEERAGENDARYLYPSFTRWRDPFIEQRDLTHWPREHKLTKDDTLSDLAREYWHKAGEGSTLGLLLDHLREWGVRKAIVRNKYYKVGDVLQIPEPPRRKIGKGRRA